MSKHIFLNKFSFSQTRKLVIIRHGESTWNKQKKWAGWSDVSLSSKGIKQAQQCGKLLRQKGFIFDSAYCSFLTRSIKTLNYILEEMQLQNIPVHKTWRLNQKHYGSLTGKSKIQITNKYGEQKVAEWRRSFDVRPPPVDINDENNPSRDRRYGDIDLKQLPLSENQSDVVKRLKPLWEDEISQKILKGENILISAHGGSARALVKIIQDLPKEDIMQLNLPHVTPLVYSFELNQQGRLSVKNMEYIGNLQEIAAKMRKVKNETKLNEI